MTLISRRDRKITSQLIEITPYMLQVAKYYIYGANFLLKYDYEYESWEEAYNDWYI